MSQKRVVFSLPMDLIHEANIANPPTAEVISKSFKSPKASSLFETSTRIFLYVTV